MTDIINHKNGVQNILVYLLLSTHAVGTLLQLVVSCNMKKETLLKNLINVKSRIFNLVPLLDTFKSPWFLHLPTVKMLSWAIHIHMRIH